MNDDQLENAIRAELAADAAATPPAGATKLAVHAAVAELSITQRQSGPRRWLVPLAAAVVLVALAAASFLVPKALTSHHPARPATPQPKLSQSVPPAPVVSLACPSGQRTVDGLSTAFTDVNNASRFAYEYYCAGPDGSRGDSAIRIYQQREGKLVPVDNEIVALMGDYLIGMVGSDGGLQLRSYHPNSTDGAYGAVSDLSYPIDPNGGDLNSTTVASDCRATDLAVSTSAAQEPVPHAVLTLTNQSHTACVVWGTPKYTIVGSVPARIRYLLSGPVGGAEGLASSPVLVVQPGHSVSASVGSDPITGHSCQEVEGVRAVLPNGVSLGTPKLGVCDNMVAYPFVDSPNGSLIHPESERPANLATGSCVDNGETVIELGTPAPVSNHRHYDVIGIRTAKPTSCTLTGYSDIRELTTSGELLAIARQSLRGPVGGVRGSAPPTVTISPGQPASVLVEWSDVATDGQQCYPSGTISMRLGGGIYSAGDLTGPVCDLQVHPFVAGTSGTG